MTAPRYHPLSRLLFCAIGIIGVQVFLGLLLYVGSVLATPWTNQRPEAQLLDIVTRFALPLTVLSYPASLLWIGFCRLKLDGRSVVSLGLRARRALPDFGRGALVGTLSIGLLASILWLTGAISVSGWSPEAFEAGMARSILMLLGYATLFFAVGFFEETLFRGYALHNAHHWLGWRGAVAVQAVIFALIHLGNLADGSPSARLAALGALPSLGLIAVFFALCYRKTGSLWFPIGFHFAWNFCLGCVFSLPVSGIRVFRLLDVGENQSDWLSGGAFGAEGSWLLIPILAALIVYISRAPDHPQALLDLGLLSREAEIAGPIAPIIETPEIEIEEEMRPNRYGTKFGTSQGFSADTLRELRDLQEAREKEQAQAREAARLDALSQLDAAPTIVRVPEPLEVALPEAPPLSQPVSQVANAEISPALETKVEAPKVEVVAPEKTAVPTEPAKKKPPSPRW